MSTIKVLNMAGAEVGTVELNDAIFGIEPNQAVVHEVVKNHLANCRQGTQSALTRGEVSGGGKKPWRQKGTGHARQGSIRAPQWTHGGVALGPKPRDYRVDLNKKTKRVALFSALSSKVAAGELIVVDEIKLEQFKTAEMVKMFKALGCQKEVTKTYKVTTMNDGEAVREKKTRVAVVPQSALVVLPGVDRFVVRSCANIPGVTTTLYSTINVYEVLKAEKVIMTKAAIEKLEEVYA